MRKNLLVGQSGGPTAVINSTLYGVIHAARDAGIHGIYGAVNGIEGLLQGKIVDIESEPPELIEELKFTPGAALGGCRYKLPAENSPEGKVALKRVFDVFQQYEIGYFIYIGGNDSMDTADKIAREAERRGNDIKVIGAPKTIDNDLVGTYYCPGFGSAAKYVAVSTREAGIHAVSMTTSEPVTILETVGRESGWLAASATLARTKEGDAPHILCLPECPFDFNNFVDKVRAIYNKQGWVFIVVGEGLRDPNGNYVSADTEAVSVDAFGHPALEGISFTLKQIIESKLNLKTTTIKLDICMQSAMHFASLRDSKDAIMVGREAVHAATRGLSGMMVALVPQIGKDESSTQLVPLHYVANSERKLPPEWIIEDGYDVSYEYLSYVRPLIAGQVEIPIIDGLPVYSRLRLRYV